MTLTNEDLLALSDMMDKKLKPIENKFNKIENRFNKIENRLDKIEADIKCLNKNISGIELHLENTTDRNITLIAEGHLDLSRKLDEALEVENEKELLLIRVNYLESEVKRIKSRLAEIS